MMSSINKDVIIKCSICYHILDNVFSKSLPLLFYCLNLLNIFSLMKNIFFDSHASQVFHTYTSFLYCNFLFPSYFAMVRFGRADSGVDHCTFVPANRPIGFSLLLYLDFRLLSFVCYRILSEGF